MFKKLITNLPFHPTLLGQVAFYVHRLKQEAALRRAGLVLIALTLIVQMFAIILPTKPSLATSSGDIIYGATSKQDVLEAYRKDRDPYGRTDIKAIFSYYGIGLEQINNAKSTVIKDSDNKNYINTSRSTTSYPDTFVKIPGAVDGGIYEFPLEYWRKSEFPSGYPALVGTSSYGFKFWILLKGCGNIVIERGTKKPELDIVKSRSSSNTTIPGDTVTYQIEFRNKGIANAENVTITDNLAKEFNYISYQSSINLNLNRNGDTLIWRIDNQGSVLAPSERWHKITLKLKAKKIDANKKLVCNASKIDASNGAAAATDNNQSARCVTIEVPTCPGSGLPIPPGGVRDCKVTCPDGTIINYTKQCKVPQLTCHKLEIIGSPSWDSRKFQTTIVTQPGGEAKQIDYFVNNKKIASEPWQGDRTTQVFKYNFAGAGTYTIRADLVAKTGNVQASQGCTLSETIEKPVKPEPRINTDKRVGNLTQKISDADNTVAKAGDVLRYTIIVNNSGDAPKTMKLEGEYGESIADIMEYADLTDKGDAIYNEKTQFLSWAEVTIKPGETVEKTFTVTVKNPIPATPTSASNPLSYDYVLHNKYGRDVNVKLDKPASKVVEQAATTLPNTGPSSSMLVSVIVAMVVGYFFYRSRLMTHELELIHHEYSTGGM